MAFLPPVELDNPLCVDGVHLVGVHHHTEEARVGLQRRRRETGFVSSFSHTIMYKNGCRAIAE